MRSIKEIALSSVFVGVRAVIAVAAVTNAVIAETQAGAPLTKFNIASMLFSYSALNVPICDHKLPGSSVPF